MSRDEVKIRHMIDAAKEALSFIKGRSRVDLESDRQLALSLIKEIEIIGEAASKVSGEGQKDNPDVPWDVIVGTRNRLIHGYFDINLDIVWSTVTRELPSLIKELEKIVL